MVEEAAATPQQTCSRLEHLRQVGLLDGLVGLAFGRPIDGVAEDQEIVLDFLADLPIPILANVDFGHTEPRLCLPLGADVELDASNRRISVELPGEG